MKTRSRLRVRYSETDQMGIVHHSRYINWFEVGRTDYIRELDKSYAEIEREGLYLPVIAAGLKYKSPAKYDEFVLVETTIAEYNGIRIKFHYRILREEDSETLVTGFTEHCWTTTDMRPTKLKKVWPELHDHILTSMEG